jgi:alanine racemase
MPSMPRSEITIDLGAIRRNVRRLLDALQGAELWAVVKADAYGHGAAEVAKVVVEEGAAALCVVTVGEGVALRAALPGARILVMGPCPADELERARGAGLELAVSEPPFPADVPIHLKLDTGMGRFGMSEVPAPPPNAVGLMSHLATADFDLAFAELQLERFRSAAASVPQLEAHVANSAAALRIPAARFAAARCGIALYGLSPFGADPANDGLEPALAWRSELALVKLLPAGESTGYGRRFIAERPAWIGLVPVGYADGFRRDLTGTEVLVAGERRRVVGTVSMDSFAVELPEALPRGAPVTLIGDGVLVEEHARVAETINYELTTGIRSWPERARRVFVDG